MTQNSLARFRALADSIAAEFPSAEPELVVRYLADIVRWNDRAGLVSKRRVVPTLERLVHQSVGLYRFLYDRGQVTPGGDQTAIDVGTGAGFPGVVWRLVHPSLRVTLVERRQKKVTFLQRMKVVLALAGLEVVGGDAVELAGDERLSEMFDLATSFAVASPSAIARTIEPFLKPGGVYATVRPLGELAQPSQIGRTLRLVATEDHDCGRMCSYRLRGSANEV